jgi:sterol-4alpha-carboxylate 3-dehydrogenase (decarboxylating)
VGASHELYKKVNVDGTACVIEACQKTGVKALVYTSSASVIHDTVSDLKNADERWPVVPPHAQREYYSQTKVFTFPFSSLNPPFPLQPRLSQKSKPTLF